MSTTPIEESEILECFKLFDQEGSGIKVKEIGTVMRSLGLVVTQAQLQEFAKEATAKDQNYVQFADFLAYARRAESSQADKQVDVKKEMPAMKTGMCHFFDKMSKKQMRDAPPDSVKIADLKHMLSAVGEKMSEEEIEEMAKEIRTNCKVNDGRVNFDDFVSMLAN
mmetsp:Transcript_9177/g.20444  ORF Transcript_9177/g.20444 Transcript_9177/m.20444 type:complete len:166 (+) Transcript_9177:141-638(+)